MTTLVKDVVLIVIAVADLAAAASLALRPNLTDDLMAIFERKRKDRSEKE
jgi:hypothetical protein